MTMYLLDTTVIPLLHPRRHKCGPALESWMEQNEDKLFLSAMTLEEIEACILTMRRERRTRRADRLDAMLEQLMAGFADRMLPVDPLTALMAARLAEAALPRKVDMRSLLIAATAKRHGFTLVSGVARRYRGLMIDVLDAHRLSAAARTLT
ncbi:MAG: PIN domain-containing protein [Acidobacteria bacterium]|nr:PIN domain-containing protein [Acidobacteriota bacterium]